MVIRQLWRQVHQKSMRIHLALIGCNKLLHVNRTYNGHQLHKRNGIYEYGYDPVVIHVVCSLQNGEVKTQTFELTTHYDQCALRVNSCENGNIFKMLLVFKGTLHT